jgi:hypothetical protein
MDRLRSRRGDTLFDRARQETAKRPAIRQRERAEEGDDEEAVIQRPVIDRRRLVEHGEPEHREACARRLSQDCDRRRHQEEHRTRFLKVKPCGIPQSNAGKTVGRQDQRHRRTPSEHQRRQCADGDEGDERQDDIGHDKILVVLGDPHTDPTQHPDRLGPRDEDDVVRSGCERRQKRLKVLRVAVLRDWIPSGEAS